MSSGSGGYSVERYVGFFASIRRDVTDDTADIYERILREVRARHRTYISKVILHPSKVVEIQIKKEKTVTRAGQWIFL